MKKDLKQIGKVAQWAVLIAVVAQVAVMGMYAIKTIASPLGLVSFGGLIGFGVMAKSGPIVDLRKRVAKAKPQGKNRGEK